MFEKTRLGIHYNTCVVFDSDGTYLGKYRKNHIPEDPLFLEKYYFTPSDLGYPVFDTAYGRIGVLICWDQWFPEAARLIALQGAQIIFYPTAIGYTDNDEREFLMWQDAVRAHGIHNELYIAACNRVGREYSRDGSIDFFGGTFISDPYGIILSEGKSGCDDIVCADIDLSLPEKVRKVFPLFRDRRIDAYKGIAVREIE